ncbi:MAG: toxic anion resistance protein [Clostridiaceae bacterium]|nr:toxic anion resistance protein [Clostridiaceae bacterium]
METGALQTTTFDLQKTQEEIKNKLMNSQEVIAIANQVDINKPDTILNFGARPAEQVSKIHDKILYSMEATRVEDSGELLNQLTKIIDKFQIKDFKEKKPGLFEKMFKNIAKEIEEFFKKYHTMGEEVQKVYVQLQKYLVEINKSNEILDEMFKNTLEYYGELEKYIYAGDMVINKIKEEVIPRLESRAEDPNDRLAPVELNNAKMMLEMLEQRIYDLRGAENIALQALPSIAAIRSGNYNLIRKLNSAVIITMPVFKSCLIQAITIKRQLNQAKALKAFDDTTNELLVQNARNLSEAMKQTAMLSGGSTFDIAKLEESWNTLKNGIEETKRIQEEIRQARIDGTQRLKALKEEFTSRHMLSD